MILGIDTDTLRNFLAKPDPEDLVEVTLPGDEHRGQIGIVVSRHGNSVGVEVMGDFRVYQTFDLTVKKRRTND